MPTLLELRKKLDKKEISAYELTRLYLNNIKKFNSQINSYITVCEDFSLCSCKKAQDLIDKNEASAMTGIPISIKDNICTNGLKTTCASKMLEDFVPFYNATVIDKLMKENAIILGKTNLDEFGMGDSNQNSCFGAVKNPYNTNHISGGSSGGSAACVAANMAPVSLGADTGGSVRQPAALCGITGLRPTYGTVSRYGLIAFASSLDQIGVLAKNAQDTGYVLNSIADENNDFLSMIDKPISNLKIGVFTDFIDNISSYEVKSCFLSVIDYFKKNKAEVIDISLPSSKFATASYLAISSAEVSSNLSRYDGLKYGYKNDDLLFSEMLKHSRKNAFGAEVKKRILLGNYVLSEENYNKYYQTACRVRNQLIYEYSEIFNKCDIIISPTTFTTARKLDFPGNNAIQDYSLDAFTVCASLAGLPEITTTCGYDKNNLPIGFSITGRAFDEPKIISVTDRFEKDFIKKEPVL